MITISDASIDQAAATVSADLGDHLTSWAASMNSVERHHSADHRGLKAALDPPLIGATMSNGLHGRTKSGTRGLYPKSDNKVRRNRPSGHEEPR